MIIFWSTLLTKILKLTVYYTVNPLAIHVSSRSNWFSSSDSPDSFLASLRPRGPFNYVLYNPTAKACFCQSFCVFKHIPNCDAHENDDLTKGDWNLWRYESWWHVVDKEWGHEWPLRWVFKFTLCSLALLIWFMQSINSNFKMTENKSNQWHQQSKKNWKLFKAWKMIWSES